ncbi:hypothetical protein Chor_010774 [Crotalus horridus]
MRARWLPAKDRPAVPEALPPATAETGKMWNWLSSDPF